MVLVTYLKTKCSALSRDGRSSGSDLSRICDDSDLHYHSGFHVQIQNLNNVNYSLKKISLLYDIEPEQSTIKVCSSFRVITELSYKLIVRLGKKGHDHFIFTKSRGENLGMLLKRGEESTYQVSEMFFNPMHFLRVTNLYL